MRFSVSLVVAVVALGIATAQAAQRTVLKIGNWDGGAYTNDSTGAFSHCALGANYLDGTRLMVSVNQQLGWTLGFANPRWQLAVGQTFPADLTFDGRGPFHVYAKVLQPTFAVVGMPDNSQLINLFRGASGMTVFAADRLLNFNLTTTSAVLPALVQCVRDNAALPAVAPAPPVSSSLNPSGADLHTEALELATNFILGAKVDNPRILGKGDTPAEYAAFGAAWTATDTAGTVKIIQVQPGTQGLEVAAQIVAADSKECRGKFASARTSDLVDSDVVFHGFSSCEDSAGVRSAQYFVIPRKAGGFVLFSVVSAMAGERAASPPSEDRLAVFRKAALTAVK
jgi:hypothetical protein